MKTKILMLLFSSILILLSPTCLAWLDLNQNGMDDWLERLYSIPANAGELDYDGDGATNAQELIAGTDPRDPNSVFRIQNITKESCVDSEGVPYIVVHITFPAVADHRYQLLVGSLENPIAQGWYDYPAGIQTMSVEIYDADPQSFFWLSVVEIKADWDGDGLSNAVEALLGTDPLNSDTDGDGLSDGFEWFYGFNPNSLPGQGERFGDPDLDGLTNEWEEKLGLNPRSNDSDGNGILDGNEDNDQDGISNINEIGGADGFFTDPTNWDTDGDGMSDGWEATYSYALGHFGGDIHPLVWNDQYDDPDGDGLSNGEESQWGTNPFETDSDGDGVPDNIEVAQGSNPMNILNSTMHPNGVEDVWFAFWDPSGSESEKYRVKITPVNPSQDPAGVRYRTNKIQGEYEEYPLKLVRGVIYKVELVHISSSQRIPDFDYYLNVWGGNLTPNKGLLIKDDAKIMGSHYESDWFFARGKSLTIALVTLKSQTDVQVPTDRARTKLGVGEEVDVMFDLTTVVSQFGPVTWGVTGGNTRLLGGTARLVTMFAGDEAHNAVVTGKVGGVTLTLTFQIIPPSGVVMIRYPGTNLFHQFGIASCGMMTEVSFEPSDVCFSNVWIREDVGNAIADGCYASSNGDPHPAGFFIEVLEGTAQKPNQWNGFDEVLSVVANPTGGGNYLWPIQWKYQVGFGAERNLGIVEQRFVCSRDVFGRVSISKGGWSEYADILWPTTTY